MDDTKAMERVAAAIAGVGYPARKDRILEHAERRGAPREVLERLRELPDVDYHSPVQVQKQAIGQHFHVG